MKTLLDSIAITPDEIATLTDLHYQIAALHQVWVDHQPSRWERMLHERRMAFREAPTPEGVERLRSFYVMNPDRLSKLRADIEQGAQTLYRRDSEPVLAGILVRAGAAVRKQLESERANERTWRAGNEHMFTGEVGSSAVTQQLERMAADIEATLAKLAKAVPLGQFPPPIATVLAVVGIRLEARPREVAPGIFQDGYLTSEGEDFGEPEPSEDAASK